MDSNAQSGDVLIGQTIGNYVVRTKLGEGGMGSVYLAEHPAIGKKVALKVLHAEFAANQDVVNRFFNEAKAVNDIQHPNIVDIVDFGTVPPLVYFIMEYLPGGTLADLLKSESPLPPERALAIALQIADALTTSHRAGIVHRDLKPDNVMLIQRGRDRDFVKLLDFGIAKLTGDKAGGSQHKTRTGIVMGTPHYMSPEQCEGRGSVDFRTDIYALGVVLFETMTGRVPFGGEGYGEILVGHLTQPVPAMQSSRGVIPPHVEQVVLRALEKRPEARFPSMEQMMYAIADPVGYVEAHGGLAGFRQARLDVGTQPTLHLGATKIAPLTPAPGTVIMPGTSTTTLGGAAAQVEAAEAAPKKKRTGLFVGLALAVAAAGAVAAVALGGGGGSGGGRPAAETEPAAAVEPAPVPEAPAPEAPVPEAPVPEAPVPDVPPAEIPAAPRAITVTIESTPAGAAVTIDGEKKPRGKTPLPLTFEPSDRPLVIALALDGYQPETRTVERTGDLTVDIELEKKERRRKSTPKPGDTGKTGGGQADDGAGSDDTLNPFAKKKQKEGTP